MPGTLNHGFAYEEEIGPKGAGRTVLAHLSTKYERATREEWASRIAGGEVRLDGAVATPEQRLSCGDTLVWFRPPWSEPEVPLSFDVLHEDDDLLAVSKRSGLPTVPGGGFLEHTLLNLVRQRDANASPMHRLGRGTSGIVLFARTPLARTAIQAAWREHRVRKTYRALVAGHVASEPFDINLPLGFVDHELLGDVFAVRVGGKPSLSRVALVEQRANDALVDVEIKTGRPHQIRIHMAAIGHPLVGDPLYLSGGVPKDSALPGDLGYLLHAARLEFAHPRSGAAVVIECAPPPSLSPHAEPLLLGPPAAAG